MRPVIFKVNTHKHISSLVGGLPLIVVCLLLKGYLENDHSLKMLSPEKNSNWLEFELHTKVCGTCGFVYLEEQLS